MNSKIEERWFKEGINIGTKVAEEHLEEFKHAVKNLPEKHRNIMKEFLVVYKDNDFWVNTLSYELRTDVENHLDYEPSTSELIEEMAKLEDKFDAGFYTGIVKYLQEQKLV